MSVESEKSSPVPSSETKTPPKVSTPSVPTAPTPGVSPPPEPSYRKRVIVTCEDDGSWTVKIKLSDPKFPLMKPELSKITRVLLVEYRKMMTQYHMDAREEARLNALAEEGLRSSGDIVSDGVVVEREDLPEGARPVDGMGTPINRTPAEAAYYASKNK